MPDLPKTECLCGVHIHSGTKIAAWISIVSSVIVGFVLFPFGLVETCIGIAVCGLMLYGLEKEITGYYIPYLVLSVANIIIECVAFVLKLFNPSTHEATQEHGAIVVILSTIVFLAVTLSSAYLFFLVPYRSYKLLKYEINSNKQLPSSMPTAPPEYIP
ncbi:hypothetical protein M3Y97_01078700 [Aphelenchoides bicaudatus]|nr:hypothetical protein M3Y97_01078700 [Aphelenchoides bicaudatus]